MKELKIYSENQRPEPLYLRLIPNSDASVVLTAVDSSGYIREDYHLLTLSSTDGVHLELDLNKNLGLPLDDKGRLKLVDYKEKGVVTFSDDELKALAIIRGKLQEEYLATTNRDVHTNLQLCISVLEKMIESFVLTSTD